MTRGILLISLLLVSPTVRAGAPMPKEAKNVLKLKAKNGLEVRLEGETVHIHGPLPATDALLRTQLPFGAASIGDGEWTTWSTAALTELSLTETASTPRVDATLWRLTVAGGRSAPIPLPGLNAARARELAGRLAAARARLTEVEEVDLAALFADPERYSGHMIKLAGVLVYQRDEGSEILRGRRPFSGFWMDAELPDGTWRITAVGLFEAERGHTYGHRGLWRGRWRVGEVLARRPAGRTLVEAARERVERAAAEAFEAVERPTLGWEPALTPAIPRPWPAAGRGSAICFLLYGWGTSKAGEHHAGSVWGRACVQVETPEAPVKVVTLARPLEDLGPARAFAPDPFAARLADDEVGRAVEGDAGEVRIRDLAPHYRAWLATRPQLKPALMAADPALWRAVE